MYAIGILTKHPFWAEKLSGFLMDSSFRISGTIPEASEESVYSSRVFMDSDVIWIPSPLPGYIDFAIQAVKLSRHVVFGFPISSFPEESCLLVELACESGVQVQVGHHEHYMPAFRAMEKLVSQPQFIDLHHHLGACRPGGRYDFFNSILIDIGLIISLVPDVLKKVQSHSTCIQHTSPPLIHVRLEFHNGTVANLSVDPYTDDISRVITVFQHQAVLRVDMNSGISTQERFPESGKTGSGTISRIWPVNGSGPLLSDEKDPEFITGECLSFLHNLLNGLKPVSSLEQGCEALKITRNLFAKNSLAEV